jgi:cytidine deaminase
MNEPAENLDKRVSDADLLLAAKRAFETSYAPYSNHHVGAALLTDDGRLFLGCNVELFNLTGGICAERTALVKALSEGQRSFARIAVASNKIPYCYPCGNCREALVEFGSLPVIVEGADGAPIVTDLSFLLPNHPLLERDVVSLSLEGRKLV